MSALRGYVFALLGAVMFGVQYLPVKKYEIFDGTTFQWFMCGGILLVGSLMSMATAGVTPSGDIDIEVNILCMFGGLLWALSNYLVIPLVKLLGLGLGFGLYHFVNLMVGYCVGRFGLFGLEKMKPTAPHGLLFCDIGCGILLIGFVLMVIVESLGTEVSESENTMLPSRIIDDSEIQDLDDFREKYRSWRLGNAKGTKDQVGNFLVQALAVKQKRTVRFFNFSLYEEPPVLEEENVVDVEDDLSEQRRKVWGSSENLPVAAIKRSATEPGVLSERLLDDTPHGFRADGCCKKTSGILLAVVAGSLCGINNVPPSLYTLQHPEKGPFAPVFSQCLGIWMTSSVIYVTYASVARYLIKWPVPHSVIRPAFLSGCIWAVGFGCMLGGIKDLGYSIGYTLDSVGPVAVSSVISIVVYKEITGSKKLTLFAASFLCQLTGVGLIAYFGA